MIYIGGLSIQYQSSEDCPIDILGGFSIDIHQRVVQKKKIDYQSMSTIYIGGLSTFKNKYFCLEMVFIHGKKIHV